MKQSKALVPILLLLSMLFSLPAVAQVSTASLTGLVKDQSDAVLPNAQVALRNQATNAKQTAKSDERGYYVFPTVPVGVYKMTVELAGFKRAEQTVTLETAQRARQDITLQVGSLETTVVVEATAPQLSPQDASLGTVIDNSYVSQFPLLSRSWDDLLALVAGVQGGRFTEQGGGTSFGRTGGFNVHGIRSLQNNFILDGIDNNSISENVQELTTQVARPSVDAIQEFKIITNPYSAEFGRSPGAAINVITKGGTNKLHGVVYEYLRNRVLDANDFFSNRNRLAKPQNVQNQFGGNLGGPIRKDRAFFFFDYEGTRVRRGVSRITTVPLPNERAGVFTTAASGAAAVSYQALYDFRTGQPFANNTIPAAMIDPYAAKIMPLFPAPTNPAAQVNNFARNAGLLDDNDRYNWRIDWQPTSKDSVFGRYSYSTRDRFIPGNFGGIADGTSTSAYGQQKLTAHAVALGWTRPLTNRIVNELRMGFARNNSWAAQDPFGKNRVADYVPGVPDNPAVAGGLSRITFTNFNTFIGSPDFLPKYQITQQYQWADTISITKGTHQLKFGGDFRGPLRNNFLDVAPGRGKLNFDRIFTCQRGANGLCVSSASGLAYADFLLGYVQQAALTNLYLVDQRLHMYSFFAQDDYKISPRLTMNLGLRYDFATPAMEGRNRIGNFSPNGAGAQVFGKSGSLQDRTTVKPDRNNFAPRLGIAYQVTQKTVVRTGYGIFYGLFDRMGSEDQLAFNPPNLIQNDSSVAASATAPMFMLRDGFPRDYLDPAKLDLKRVRVRGANPDAANTYVQQWSFSLQRLLPLGLFAEAAYVGTKTTRLNTLRNFNQPIAGQRPYPNFNQIEYRDPLGNAIYHGLELTLERRFRKGLGFRGAYTWSKSIDNTAEHLAVGGSNSFNQDGRNFHAWRGPSDFDYTQRLVLGYIYDLPFGKGKKLAPKGPVAWIVGGFQLSGSAVMTTGRPYTVFAGGNNSLVDSLGMQQALANVVGQPVLPRNVDCWFYSSGNRLCRGFTGTDAFAVPPSSSPFGNVGRNTLRGPGQVNFDFSVHRTFLIRETRSLEFRWEMFNMFNTPQFGLPDRNVSGSSAGAITALANDPRLMQFALRLKF